MINQSNCKNVEFIVDQRFASTASVGLYFLSPWETTISWLSPACLDCYLHGQAFLILQHKTLSLLVDQ
jgi:hypothetical protein